MNNDDMSEAEFDAFLNGKGDLSRRLQALPQPGPSAELDAAILNRVRFALAQQQRPAAANDPADEAPTPRLQPNFATRWRLPVGIAATVLAGVFAHQAFQVTQEASLAEAMPAPVVAQEATPAAALPAPAGVMADAAPALEAKAPAAEKKAAAPRMREPARPAAEEVRELARAQVAKPAPVEEALAAAAPPPPPPAPAPPAPAAPAVSSKPEVARLSNAVPIPAPAPAMDKSAHSSEQVVVTGSRIASAAPSGTPAVEWLALIESLLKADLKRDALTEWRRFRAEYPAYPVPDELQAKIKAIEP